MKKHIVLFSGLGADERAFQYLDFSEYSVTTIQWISPQKRETIESYASRLIPQITVDNPILIGLSFGGILAVEVAKQLETTSVILIASAKTKWELPFYYRWAGSLRLHRLIPVRFLKRSTSLSAWFFGIESPADRNLLSEILADTDPEFLSWALDQAARWKNTFQLPNVKHIHGTKDRILPIHSVKNATAIQGAGHFMTVNRAKEINLLLKEMIDSYK